MKEVTAINKDIALVHADVDMTPDEKTKELNALYKERSDVAKDVYDLRPGGKENEFSGGETKPILGEGIAEFIFNLSNKPKKEQVDELIGAALPHTATLINDISISNEKLRRVV